MFGPQRRFIRYARIMMNLSEVLNIPPYINVLSELAERSLTVTDLYHATSGASRLQVIPAVQTLPPKFQQNLVRSSKSVTRLIEVQGLTTLASGVTPPRTVHPHGTNDPFRASAVAYPRPLSGAAATLASGPSHRRARASFVHSRRALCARGGASLGVSHVRPTPRDSPAAPTPTL